MELSQVKRFESGEIISPRSEFVYKMNPQNYLHFAAVLQKEPEFLKILFNSGRFSDRRAEISGDKISVELKNELKTSLNMMESDDLDFSEYCRHYHQFFKELGAALKFNPLAANKSGKLLREKLLPLLEQYRNLIHPATVYRKVRVHAQDQGLQLTDHDVFFRSRKLAEKFQGVEDVILYLVTIGPGIDHEVKTLSAQGEVFEAYVLNGIGGAAAEMAAYDLNLFFNEQMSREGSGRYTRFSPGYGDWLLQDQVHMFHLLKPEKLVGVRLTAGGIMLPEKSTSGIMGWITG